MSTTTELYADDTVQVINELLEYGATFDIAAGDVTCRIGVTSENVCDDAGAALWESYESNRAAITAFFQSHTAGLILPPGKVLRVG